VGIILSFSKFLNYYHIHSSHLNLNKYCAHNSMTNNFNFSKSLVVASARTWYGKFRTWNFENLH
jgi:hypothetical protein